MGTSQKSIIAPKKTDKKMTFPFRTDKRTKSAQGNNAEDTARVLPDSGMKSKRGAISEIMPIKLKLALSHVLILMIPVIVIVVLLFVNAKGAILKEVEQANLALADQVSKFVDMKLNAVDATSVIMVSDPAVLEAISKSEKDYESLYHMQKDRDTNLYSLINSLRAAEKGIDKLVFIKDNEVIDPDETDVFQKADFIKTFLAGDVYSKTIANKSKPIWFYGLFETHDLYFMRSIRNIYAENSQVILMVSLKADYLTKGLDAAQLGEGARMTIVDNEGKVVVSTDPKLVMGDILKISDELNKESKSSVAASTAEIPVARGSFVTSQNVNDETMVVFKETVSGWRYVAEIPTSSIYGGINKMSGLAIVLVFVCFGVSLVLGIILAISIARPIDYIRSRMQLVEQGDLTIRSALSGKYEFGQLSQSFNAMTENMASLIKGTSQLSLAVSTDAEELQRIAEHSVLASKEVTGAVESMSEGAIEQSRDAEKAAEVIKELVDQMSRTESSFAEVVHVTNKTKKASSDATQIIAELGVTTALSIDLSTSIKSDMGMLAAQFKEILGIIDMINAISSQTNLLALNAAIEAARAGEAGRGFAVVADEVRKLASQSNDAAKNISDIVNSIYKATKKTEDKIEDGSVIYKRQEEAVKNTEKTFTEIATDMDSIMHEVDKVYKLLSGMDAIQTSATSAITSIVAISEESASATEEILATGEEQTASADHLAEMAIKLSMAIETMNANVKRFKV